MTDAIDMTAPPEKANRDKVIKEKVNVRCFCVLMLFLCAVTVLIPADKKVERLENRTLNKAPDLSLRSALNGGFSKEFEDYIADRVGFRTDFILLSKSIEGAYGVAMREAPTVIFSNNPVNRGGQVPARANNASEQNESASQARGAGGDSDYSHTGLGAESQGAATQGASPQNSAPPADVGPVRAGPLLAFPDRLMELFGYSERACSGYAEAINSYAEALEGKARVFSLIAPTAIEFIDEKYKSASDSELDAITAVDNRLGNVIPVDAYSYLSSHRNEYVYFRTDHHWTALGAYYAYLAYCGAAGLEPVTIDEYDSFELPGFLGYLYNTHPVNELRENPDTIVYYKLKEPVEVSSPLHVIYGGATYSIFIGGDNPIYEIRTSAGNGRTCAVIKDSFGNAFVPWLAPNYENIIVFDPRNFNGSVIETLEKYGDIDLIVLNSAFTAGSGGFNGLLASIQ